MTKNQTLSHPVNLLIAAVCTVVALFLLQTTTTHAASFSVAAGNDENADNASCALSEAIENINNQATTNTDCTPTGAYGTDDTINLPAGTITLTADVPQITQPITVQGQGMGVSIVDGDGAYFGITSIGEGYNLFDVTLTGIYQTSTLASGGDVVMRRVEVDGDRATPAGSNTVMSALSVTSENASSDINVTLSDIYVHNFSFALDQFFAIGVSPIGTANINYNISNITITNIENTQQTGPTQSIGIVLATGMFDNGATTATLSGATNNITITDMRDAVGAVYGVATAVFTTSSNDIDTDMNNITVRNLSSGGGGFLNGDEGAAVMLFGAAQVLANVNVDVSNLLLSGSGVVNCKLLDTSSAFGLSGTANLSLTSTGGNLSDDTSCSSYFTQASDQNNLANLSSTLSALADNGGYVPTMALLPNSPAIDSGVTVAGLTTDARLATRPQGTAYDSGAYESPFTKTVESAETLANTGQNIKLAGIFAALLLTLGFALQLRRQYV